jgi:hypothetical protein
VIMGRTHREKGMNTNAVNDSIACPRCRANVAWPQSLSTDQKRLLADTSRKSLTDGARLAKSSFNLDLGGAKALSAHISADGGKCHGCGAQISEEVSICPRCHSANLDW